MEVGYVGLGNMGGALARRLLKSRKLRVFDVNPKSAADLVSLGAISSSSLAELALQCDVVMICVPRSANVRAAIFGTGGLAEGLTPGKFVLDQTSGDPAETRRMAAELKARGISMLDAPVSGGPQGADAGTISIMVGGDEGEYRAIHPLLLEISPNVFRCGDVGAGQVLKLINNTISTCNRFAMLEGVAMGLKNGLSLEVMKDALNKGGGRSASSEGLLPALARGERQARFALALMLKDLNLATGLALESGATLQFGQLARGMLQAAANAYGPDANLDDIVDLVAAQSGVSFDP